MAGLQTAYLVKVESHVRLLWKRPITFVAIICHTNILHAYLKVEIIIKSYCASVVSLTPSLP